MQKRFEGKVQQLMGAVCNSSGESDLALRNATKKQVERISGLSKKETALDNTEILSDALKTYLEKIALHAYKITDEDIARLRREGYAEDAIFELTITAALSAGMSRLERGLKILKEGNRHAFTKSGE